MAIVQKPEIIWMAWSPDSNYLPQAASVNRHICQQMMQNWGFSRNVKCVRVLVQAAPKSKTRKVRSR